MLKQSITTLEFQTGGRGLTDITGRVRDWVRREGIGTGLLTAFLRHTSASLLVQENADADVQADLERFFSRLVADGDPLFRHVTEGPDDMPAHVRAALTQTHVAVPVVGGALALGTWQGIYLYEHRRAGHHREVVLHVVGDGAGVATSDGGGTDAR